MARIARVVAPGIRHQITQRGKGRQETFFWPRGLPGLHGAAVGVAGGDDALVTAAPVLALVGNWMDLLATGAPEDEVKELRRHERSGRPLGR